MTVMQLRFVANADSWVRYLCHDSHAYVKILGLKLTSGNEVAHFVDIAMGEENAESVRDWLSDPGNVGRTELSDLSRDHLLGVVMSEDCSVCRYLAGTVSYISMAATEEDCMVGYKLFLNSEGVPEFLTMLAKSGVDYRVVEISPVSEDRRVTTRQFGILKSAMEMGLYDFPRRITQDELAERLGISTSTLNEILRRAERKILGSYFGDVLTAAQ